MTGAVGTEGDLATVGREGRKQVSGAGVGELPHSADGTSGFHAWLAQPPNRDAHKNQQYGSYSQQPAPRPWRVRGFRSQTIGFHVRNEPIAGSGGGFDVSGVVSIIAKLLAKLGNDASQDRIGHESARPNVSDQLLFGDHPVAILYQVEKNAQRLRFQGDYTTAPPDFETVGIRAAFPKPIGWGRFRHQHRLSASNNPDNHIVLQNHLNSIRILIRRAA
jgi:hypothetical protein